VQQDDEFAGRVACLGDVEGDAVGGDHLMLNFARGLHQEISLSLETNGLIRLPLVERGQRCEVFDIAGVERHAEPHGDGGDQAVFKLDPVT